MVRDVPLKVGAERAPPRAMRLHLDPAERAEDDLENRTPPMRRLLDLDGRDMLPYRLPDAEFESRFGTEEACRDFLFKSRWPDGFRCPRCQRAGAFRWLDMRRILCFGCRRKTSLTAGTILHRTRKPLTVWFRAAFLVAQRGANARVLKERQWVRSGDPNL